MASKLEELANQFRIDNTKGNTYQNTESGKYGSTHKNALSDGDSHGKGNIEASIINGLGKGFYDINGNVGDARDIYGVASEPDSGRIRNIKLNPYNFNNQYKHPDTNGNEGQFSIGG